MQVTGFDKVFAIADEDLERDTEDKTSAVHFLRFELNDTMLSASLAGAAIAAGVEHQNLSAVINPLPDNITDSLRQDLKQP